MLLLLIHVLRYSRRTLVAWATLLLTATLATAVPLVTTGDASGLKATAAVLHGTVIPNEPVSVYFEYELAGATNAYGNRTEAQEFSGSAAIPVAASLGWLKGGAAYRYRLVAVDHNVQKTYYYGGGIIFTTPPELPVAVTGNPVIGANSGIILKGAVNPNGLPAQVRFLYGPTTIYGTSTDMQSISSGSGIVDISSAEIPGLTVGATYHYRIIAITPAGTRQGADMSFVVPISGGGTGSPTAEPIVTTGGFSSVNTNSAELSGTVNPNDGITVAQFEYGMTASYGHLTALQNVGDGHTPVAVSLTALELLAGTRYHYRLIASNSHGAGTPGEDMVLDTAPAAPTVVTGTANVINTTSATVTGTVRARGSDALVFIDYGTSPAFLSNSISAGLEPVTGDVTTVVGATIEGLIQGATYYYRVRAVNAGGTARGEILTVDVGVLSNPDQVLPTSIEPADRQWSVTVNLTPSAIGGGWRFEGEWDWRASGIPASGLTAGMRVIEYRRVPGYLPVPAETVTVPGSIVINHTYAASGVTGSGALSVMLQPADLTGAQWRFFGEPNAQWNNSEFTATGLAPGDYVIECKPVAGRTTPPPATASVTAGKTTLATMIYYLAEDPAGTPPAIPPGLLSFETVSTGPYAYVGQITSDAGCGTGFVVRPRVVATAGHVVFDDVTLAATTGLRWYFQRHRGEHEPLAQIPRGYDLLSGYADRRMAEKTPGTSTPESQNLDVAALYFLADAGRGGYGGYFASDAIPNEFVTSTTAMKTLVGYPVDGIIPDYHGKMHATLPAAVGFSHVTGQVYTTTQIRSSGGNSGGPLCVQNAGGVYYPAAIYLGGSSHMVVRAIDSEVVALFQAADVVIYPVPVFTLQPVAGKDVPYGMETTLAALASISMTADTTLRYQWYEGASGDISKPVAGATSPTFTTPAVTMNTMYWVRAISDSCGTSADSAATTITVLSSANADLSNLTLSQGVLSPAFNADILTYDCDVPYSTSISIKPEARVAISTTTITVGGFTVASGSFSPAIPLTGDLTVISLTVTTADQTTKQYTIKVTRSLPPTGFTTLAATDVTQDSATLHGSVIPNGTVSAYFQYLAPGDTTIKTTPVQILSGGADPMAVDATVSGLADIGDYNYHLVVVSGTVAFNGLPEKTFAISKLPVVATGTPVVVGTTGNNPPYKVTLTGAVNPMGLITTNVYFDYGPTQACGTRIYMTPNNPSGSSVANYAAEVPGLIPNNTYYHRLVAATAAGTGMGEVVEFTVVSSVVVTPAAPQAVTAPASDMTVSSATLHGQVKPNGSSTFAYFEYGTDTNYGSTTLRENKGNGGSMISVAQSASGLLPGTRYYYRCVAENGSAVVRGDPLFFDTIALPPLAATGTAEALTSTSAKVHAIMRARDASATVGFEYSTDKDFLTGVATVPAVESPVTVDVDTPVSAVLTGLSGGTLYYFRVKATNTGGDAYGLGQPLQADSLLGFRQNFTSAVAANDYQGQVQVILEPSGGGWRFVGESQWRLSGATAGGLTTGDRRIEYQPLDGRIQPPSEMVGVVSRQPPAPVVLKRYYYDSAGPGDPEQGTLWIGNLSVLLQPDAAVANGARWRLAGDTRTEWINSGEMMPGILPGSYLVECKQDISGFAAPTPMKVTVRANQDTTITITYFKAMAPTNVNLELVSLTDASTRQDLPYAYVGMLRSGTGGIYTGFVVKPQVVATVAQAVFDEATLTATSDLQWLLQRNQDQFEPVPQIPRGSHVLTDYAAQRAADATPGTFSNASLNLNVAALYFSQAAGRGGFSGFLAPVTGTPAANGYLISDLYNKTLVGYPLKGVVNGGQMYATSLEETNPFIQTYEQLYTNPFIQGVEGMLGGPLCVQYQKNGIYYPAGILVGGDTGNAIRAIDSSVVELFTMADTSANGGANDTGGGITHSSFSIIGSPSDPGALKVTIEPEAARTAGAGWRLSPEVSHRSSGAQKNGLNSGNYILQLKTVNGFQDPAEETVFITGGQLREVTYTYLENYTPQELWRLANFGTTSNTGDAADDADPDCDGCPNIHEYAAATDPNDSSDMFRILTTVKDETGFTITVPGKATRTYVFERCTNLGSGVWTEVDSAGPLDSDRTVTLTDPSPPPNTGFYRARVSSP